MIIYNSGSLIFKLDSCPKYEFGTKFNLIAPSLYPILSNSEQVELFLSHSKKSLITN